MALYGDLSQRVEVFTDRFAVRLGRHRDFVGFAAIVDG